MSVHDAVVILILTNDMKKEYRVGYIPNLQSLATYRTLKNCFFKSARYNKMNAAVKKAQELQDKYKSRYGLLRMNRYNYFEWDDILEGAEREERKLSDNQPF